MGEANYLPAALWRYRLFGKTFKLTRMEHGYRHFIMEVLNDLEIYEDYDDALRAKNHLLSTIELMLNIHLNEMPLFINSEIKLLRFIAIGRLKVG